jgi:signal transduction histidine kinase
VKQQFGEAEVGVRGPQRWALYGMFALLALAAVSAIVLSFQAADAERWVDHTLEVRNANQIVLTEVQDATLGERGYLITHDERYLTQYRRAVGALPAAEGRLRWLSRDNADAGPRLDRLHAAITAQLRDLASTIALLDAGRAEEAAEAVRRHVAANHLDEVRSAVGAIQAAEGQLLAVREARVNTQRGLLEAMIILALVATVAQAFLVVGATRRHVAEVGERNAALEMEIARRSEAEAQLRQSQKMEAIGQLTGGIAHDFNNMLAIVIGNLELLAKRLKGDPDRRGQFVEQALEGAERAARLTRSLLAFSRQQALEPAPLDVNRSVAEMSRLLGSTLGEGVIIETVLAGGLWPAFIDASQLQSAILNLAINARDAMPGGGKLTLETANAYLDETYARTDSSVTPGRYVLVALTDTGEGMSPEIMAKAFDPFFSTKPVGKGTGLGLSQVHGFIKQSGGHLKLYSEPGKGTTVRLYLPVARAAAVGPEDAAEPVPERVMAGASILVVEDEASVLKFACNALADLGYKAYPAASAKAGLARLESTPDIALLLTDVVMPDMNGRALSQAALAIRPDLKVLYMTGYTQNAIVHNGVLDADARLISKPFTLSQLATKVAEALAD